MANGSSNSTTIICTNPHHGWRSLFPSEGDFRYWETIGNISSRIRVSCSILPLLLRLTSNDTTRMGSFSLSGIIVARFTFSYKVSEYITLPSFGSISFLVLILKTVSTKESSDSLVLKSGSSPSLYWYTITAPLLFMKPANLIELSSCKILLQMFCSVVDSIDINYHPLLCTWRPRPLLTPSSKCNNVALYKAYG